MKTSQIFSLLSHSLSLQQCERVKISNIFTFLFNRDSVSHRVSLFAAFSIGCVECVAYSWARKKTKLCLVVAAVVLWKHSHTPKSEGITPSKATHSYQKSAAEVFQVSAFSESETRKAHEANAHKQSGPQQIEHVDFFLAFISEAYEYEQF